MCEWASKQTPDPKNSTPPPRLIFLDPPLTTQTHKTIQCSSKSNNNSKTALYGQNEKRYSTTQHCTDTKQNNIVQQQHE